MLRKAMKLTEKKVLEHRDEIDSRLAYLNFHLFFPQNFPQMLLFWRNSINFKWNFYL